ncbi:MAG TPA: efflux RND transporter permease subunit, partial [Rhizobiales bacterium]|nr:efflux RND transporter permease subunit [Hyphomicrobiales bacterium]
LQSMRIRTPNGMVPLSNFVKREVKPAVDSIIHKDGLVSVFVKANVVQGIDPNVKIAKLKKWLASEKWADGVTFRFRGGDEDSKKSQAFLTKAMAASVFLMFIILVTQFNSFYHAILTLSTLVMSIAGVLIGMMVTGQAFSVVMTGVGVVALAGIVVNNAIVLIDTYHVLLDEGMEVREAVLRTAAQRLRPVMLTTVTTILGLLPMIFEVNLGWLSGSVAIGSQSSAWWVQLATAISFGLGFATLLTLFLTPVLLAAPTVWKETLMRKPAEPTGSAVSTSPQNDPSPVSEVQPAAKKKPTKKPAKRGRKKPPKPATQAAE